MNEPTNKSVGKVIAVWLVVAVPAAWGVSQTVIKSLPLFTALSGAPKHASNTAPATMSSPTTMDLPAATPPSLAPTTTP